MNSKNQSVTDRTITVGNATVPYGWDNYGRLGWRLPGGYVTDHYPTALAVATRMARLMA
jgi:hypothetical protein